MITAGSRHPETGGWKFSVGRFMRVDGPADSSATVEWDWGPGLGPSVLEGTRLRTSLLTDDHTLESVIAIYPCTVVGWVSGPSEV